MGFRLGEAVPFPEPGNPASFVHVIRAWRTRFAPNQIGIGQRARVVNSPKPNALPVPVKSQTAFAQMIAPGRSGSPGGDWPREGIHGVEGKLR